MPNPRRPTKTAAIARPLPANMMAAEDPVAADKVVAPVVVGRAEDTVVPAAAVPVAAVE